MNKNILFCLALIANLTQVILSAGHFSEDNFSDNTFQRVYRMPTGNYTFEPVFNNTQLDFPSQKKEADWKEEIDWNNPDKLFGPSRIKKMSALFHAITFIEPDIAIKLLEHGANPNTEGSGIPALAKILLIPLENHFQRLKPVMVKLLQKGANANQKVNSSWQDSMLHLAIQENRDIETLQILLAYKANPNQPNTFKACTPLTQLASRYVDNTNLTPKNDLVAKGKLLMRYGAIAHATEPSEKWAINIAPKLIAEIEDDFKQEKSANHVLHDLIDQSMGEDHCFPLDMKVMISCMLRHKL